MLFNFVDAADPCDFEKMQPFSKNPAERSSLNHILIRRFQTQHLLL